MGCCFSRPSGLESSSPYSGPLSSSARALNSAAVPSSSSAPPSAAGAGTMVSSTAATTAAATGIPSPGGGGGARLRRSGVPTATTTARAGGGDGSRLDAHINAPLRRHVWTSSTTKAMPRRHGQRARRWTRTALTREREDFFDTRVTGRPEVWGALQYVASILRDPAAAAAAKEGPEGAGAAGGLATAQGILDAAGITVPTGELGESGAYDEAGNFYSIPGWVVAEPPPEIIAPEEERGGNQQQEAAAAEEVEGSEGLPIRHEVRTKADDEGQDDDDDDLETDVEEEQGGHDAYNGHEDADDPDDEVARRREEKGKAVLDIRNTVKVTARLSETSRDITLRIVKTETVRSIARRIADEARLPPSKRVHIAYLGQLLKEGVSLPDQGWQSDHMVNAFVFDTAQLRS